jgi:hypothetical protein
MNQEVVALLIVAVAAGVALRKGYKTYMAPGLANWLLKKGRVKWAMKIKAQAKAPGCSDCH